MSEPWLDKKQLAGYLSCSIRSIQTALAQGMPHAVIFGRVKFRVSEVEPWLEEHGYLQRSYNGVVSNQETPDERTTATRRA